jgi:hypothetical protein
MPSAQTQALSAVVMDRRWVGCDAAGHGSPRSVPKWFRAAAGILSDALFLIIALRLLQVRCCRGTCAPLCACVGVAACCVRW